MSNWYTRDTWLEANDVDAWAPSSIPITYTSLAPSGTPTAINIKQPKSDSKQVSKVPPKVVSGAELISPPPTSVKFFELPTNAATHQGAWDAYIMVIDPLDQKEGSQTPSIDVGEFISNPAEWNQSRSLETTPNTENHGGFPKLKRNADIEAELVKQNLYKTELCQSWIETGSCRYGSKCQFAHGEEELRPVLRHPKYKTEICKTFSNTGQCPYGKRCRFVHQLYELRASSSEIDVQADEDEVEEIKRKLNELNLNLSPDPVFPAPDHSAVSTQAKKGSRLPFFQKLRSKQKW